MNQTQIPKPTATMTNAFLLCLFLGGLGIHRMVLGYKNWWVMLVVSICTLGFGGMIWGLIDIIAIVTRKMGMADGRRLL